MIAFLLACQPDSITYINQSLSEFALIDHNTSSPTFEESVSTTDFPEMISAWYFGHST